MGHSTSKTRLYIVVFLFKEMLMRIPRKDNYKITPHRLNLEQKMAFFEVLSGTKINKYGNDSKNFNH